jgi:hypothetical protein
VIPIRSFHIVSLIDVLVTVTTVAPM